MANETRQNDAAMRAKALSRWEGEGGALVPTRAADTIDESEMRILARLGAALLDHWNELPPAAQDRIVRRAKTLGGPGDHAHVKEQLAGFLRSRCNEG